MKIIKRAFVVSSRHLHTWTIRSKVGWLAPRCSRQPWKCAECFDGGRKKSQIFEFDEKVHGVLSGLINILNLWIWRGAWILDNFRNWKKTGENKSFIKPELGKPNRIRPRRRYPVEPSSTISNSWTLSKVHRSKYERSLRTGLYKSELLDFARFVARCLSNARLRFLFWP